MVKISNPRTYSIGSLMDFSLILQQFTQSILSFFVFGALFCSIMLFVFLPISFHPRIRKPYPSAPKQSFIAMLLSFFIAVTALNVVNSAWFAQSFKVVNQASSSTETSENTILEDDPFIAAYRVPETVDLYFASVPSGADVYFDDVYMGQTPLATSVTKARKFHYAVIADPKTYTPYAGMFSAEKEENLSIHAGLLTDELTNRLEEAEEAALVPEQELFVQTIEFSQENSEITAKLHNNTDSNYNYAFISFRVLTEEAEELEPQYTLIHNIKAGERYTFSLPVPETVTEVKLLSVLPLSPY